jgi:hypothetical protein
MQSSIITESDNATFIIFISKTPLISSDILIRRTPHGAYNGCADSTINNGLYGLSQRAKWELALPGAVELRAIWEFNGIMSRRIKSADALAQ